MSKTGDHLINVMNTVKGKEALIKQLGLEKLSLELQAEVVKVSEGDEMSEELFDALFDSPLAERMPYGTAKARTGDPVNWLSEKIMAAAARERGPRITSDGSLESMRRRWRLPYGEGL